MKNYRFILPNIQKKLIGTQGEQARFIPYRLEEDLTPEDILKELRRQPHMAQLVQTLDAGRRVYLLEGPDAEQLFLAAEYIGTWHRMKNESDECYDAVDDEDGETDLRTFDFDRNLPFLTVEEVREFYSPDEGFGFGNSVYLPNLTPQKRPWWTLSQDAPIVLSLTDPDSTSRPAGYLSSLPRIVENMESRTLVIILFACPRPDQERKTDPFCVQGATMEDISFELETDCIRLGAPDQESRYKLEVLRQLAREKDAPLSPKANGERILSLIEEHRGNVSNRTIAKAVSNALLRRRTQGPLRDRDFDYLSSVFPVQRQKQKESAPELVGQPEIRRQLTRVVDSMVFQKRRKDQGLPCSPIHYTFAFLGAPGTGKTSWARWLAAEMERRELLNRSSAICCINAAELKAQYVGHTTGKVKAIFQQYDVIILDEAYSLAEGEGDDCFAREALAQLCVELEDHAEDRLVIFAGYGGSRDPGDNRMLRFLQSNPGINSRVSFKIFFQDFQVQDLTEVFRSMLEWERYVLPPETAAADDFFRHRLKSPAFGNCREARNLADRVKLRLAARLAGCEDCPKEEFSRVLPQDIEDAAAEILEEYRTLERDGGRTIGFSGERTGRDKI